MDEQKDICFFCLGTREDGEIIEYDSLFPCQCVINVHADCLKTWLEERSECPICHRSFEHEADTRELDQPLRIVIANQTRINHAGQSCPMVETVLFVIIVFVTVGFFLYPGTRAQLL